MQSLERRERLGGPSTIEVMADRIRRGSKRGQRDDPWKVCLLVEGGGMAGIITAKMLERLAYYDPHLDSIDVAAGNSAGILNLVWVFSDQGDRKEIKKGIGIYPRLVEPPFFDPRRLMNGVLNNGKPPAIFMKHLIYDVMGGDVPLQWQRVGDKGLPLHTYITNPADASLRVVDLSSIKDQDQFFRNIELTSTIPVYGGLDPEGTDGGMGSKGPPIREVLGDPSITHILTLLSRPEGIRIADVDPRKSFAAQVLRWHDLDDLARNMATWNRGYKANLRLMDRPPPVKPRPGNPFVQTVKVPRTRPQIDIMERDRGKLEREAQYGQHAIDAKLGRRLAATGHVFPDNGR
jgi:hypothetical protein